MKPYSLICMSLAIGYGAFAGTVADSQQSFIERYEHQTKKVAPENALINTDPEPDLSSGFVDLYNGENLDGWLPLGGTCTFEPAGDRIIGTVVKGSPSTYLTTIRDDYADFVFTAEVYWEVESNSGIMFRAAPKLTQKGVTVQGPQTEMEPPGNRNWAGGIYGQAVGGWFYPLWLEAHEAARNAIQKGAWNRVTILCQGPTVKTWINGVPAAHWTTDEYRKGFFSLQVHSGKEGEVHFRNIKVKELPKTEWSDLLSNADLSEWSRVNGQAVDTGWQLADGILERSGQRPGSIITKAEYEDFELRFDWKISKNGNSGVKYRSRGSLGLEYQILDDDGHKDGADPARSAAAQYDIIAAIADKPLNPVGEWNQSRIMADGSQIEHWLNGTKVVDTDIASGAWIARFKESKYHEHEGFGHWRGPILLQDHGDPVWYRNIQIREL